ncbi:MAG: sigma-54-dependent transcriptional regulator [Myxococcaceae bacterium]
MKQQAALDVLLVEDEPSLRMDVAFALSDAGHRVTEASDGGDASALLGKHVYDVAILDVRLPRVDGMTLFRRLRKESPATAVVLMTAYATVTDAVAVLREGAYDYICKPFDAEEFTLRVIGRVAEECRIRRELSQAQTELAERGAEAVIIGRSPAIVGLKARMETVADSDAPVLITGESGTGKELIARTLHARSSRRDMPFVAVNCAAFPETLLEAELFGHEKGAFTSALRKRDGRFKAAHGGTLLLDEVGEIPLPAQAKLLRVLQEGTIEPLGTNVSIPVDVRIISATHRNLKEMIAAGTFREDLYYRLHVLDLSIPPLRSRKGDIPLLLQHFLRRFTPSGQLPSDISPRAWARLLEYRYRGNVREFAHAIEHAVVLARGGAVDLHHLPSDIVGSIETEGMIEPETFRTLSGAVSEFEREYLMRALAHSGGSRTRAAELLGISRKNLWEKLRLHGISATEVDDYLDHTPSRDTVIPVALRQKPS